MKVSDLSSALLDFWVAKAEGWEFFWSKHNHWVVTPKDGNKYTSCEGWKPFDPYTGKKSARPHPYKAMENFFPSSDWSDGGPIIDRWEEIAFTRFEGRTYCTLGREGVHSGSNTKSGETKLIAAMRCYVASKFGAEVPDEVTERG